MNLSLTRIEQERGWGEGRGGGGGGGGGACFLGTSDLSGEILAGIGVHRK